MIFKALSEVFKPDSESLTQSGDVSIEVLKQKIAPLPHSYVEFLETWRFPSCGGGVVRFLLPSTSPSVMEWNGDSGWGQDWTEWRSRLTVFGYDWLGRQFAFDNARVDPSSKEPLVSILEPGTGLLLEVPRDFNAFMESEMIVQAEAVLAYSFFQEWLSLGGQPPKFNECIGYKTPLFLGGDDDTSNLEVINLDVYISILGQLYNSVR
jgi:hypothetical protein